MSIFRTAYETTSCREFRMERTVAAVEQARAYGDLASEKSPNLRFVQGGSSASDSVPGFAHPLLVVDSSKHEYIAVDVRNYGVFNKMTNSFDVRNIFEYDMQKLRAGLNWIWVSQSPNILRDISPIPMAVFASWISETVASRVMLDPQEQLTLQILSGFFYSCLFVERDHTLTDQDKFKMAGAIARSTNIQAEAILNVIEELPQIQDVKMFCEFAKQVVGSVRLEDFNAGVLYGMLGKTWFGTHASETVAVALEHPPTWLSILYAAYNSRTFKHARITEIAQIQNKRDAGPAFVRSLVKLVHDFDL